MKQAIQALLLQAADLIRDCGLAKGTQYDPRTGGYCVQGALSVVANGELNKRGALYDEASIKLRDWILDAGYPATEDFNLDLTGCAGWNNAPERTAEEVIMALKGAANS